MLGSKVAIALHTARIRDALRDWMRKGLHEAFKRYLSFVLSKSALSNLGTGKVSTKKTVL